MLLFDAHLDLACLAVHGRDMLAPPETAGGPWQPGAVTLPSLAEGDVRIALATIFTEADGKEKEGYPAGDVEAAHQRGREQLAVYESWRGAGHITIDLPALLREAARTGAFEGGMGWKTHATTGLHIGILMENADPIRSPDELAWWKGRGVVAVGLAWARSSRYATGNGPRPFSNGGADAAFGLTDLGRAMVKAMDALGIVHDVSHLSDRAMDELLALTDRPVIASHSNCRAILKGDMGPEGKNHRQLRDESILEIARRGGVIGLNLVRNFIPPREYGKDDPRPTIDEAVAHVERICEFVGHRRAVGLGTDMDGGITADDLPLGIDRPRDLVKILTCLRARGWSEEEVEGFAWANWARCLAPFH